MKKKMNNSLNAKDCKNTMNTNSNTKNCKNTMNNSKANKVNNSKQNEIGFDVEDKSFQLDENDNHSFKMR